LLAIMQANALFRLHSYYMSINLKAL